MSHEPLHDSAPVEGGTTPAGGVLATFVDTLLRGKRVALLGDSSSELGPLLAASSGRRVHVFDPDTRRAGVSIASRRGDATPVAVTPLDDGLDDHLGAFDAVLVPDVTPLGDATALLARLTALLSRRGFLLLGAPNPEHSEQSTIGYYELYDAVAEHFEHVAMFGQAPFAGFTVANFAAEGEPAVTIDASLMQAAEEPQLFVALASHTPLQVDPYVLVQVPFAPAPSTTPSPEDHAALVEAQLQRSLLSTELEKLRGRELDATRRLSESEANLKKLAARVSELQGQLDREQKRSNAELREARRAAEARQNRVRQLESELAHASSRDEASLEAQRAEIEDAHQEDLDRMLERIAELEEAAETAQAAQREEAARREAAEKRDEAGRRELASYREQAAQREKALQAAIAKHEQAAKTAQREQQERDTTAQRERQERDETAQRERQEREKAEARREADKAAEAGSAQDVRAFEFQIGELRQSLDGARRERDDAKRELRRLADEAKRHASLATDLAAARAKAAELQKRLASGDDTDDEHGRELAALEQHLREQGQVAAKLRTDLRESERIGRELLSRLLEAQRDATPLADANGETRTLRAQLDALAQRCTRYEADLKAASWKITELTAQIEDDDGTSDHDKLETALRTAHADLAQLKQQLAKQTRPDAD